MSATPAHLDQWARLRQALWNFEPVERHRDEARAFYCAGHPARAAFIAFDDDDRMIGFAEATLRRDYVEGCDTSPVAFLEGIYVAPAARKAGTGRALVDAVAQWGRARGCGEFASNALIDNESSHRFHVAVGFAETERVVYFKQDL